MAYELTPSPEQGMLFVTGDLLVNPALVDPTALAHETQIAGRDVSMLFGSNVVPLYDDEHRRVGEFTRSVFDRLTAEPNAVLLSAEEDPLWLVDRKQYLDDVAKKIGNASLGIAKDERARKIVSGVGQTRGGLRTKMVHLRTSAERMRFSAGMAYDLVGQTADCGFDDLTVMHHIAEANGGLDALFKAVARVEHPGLDANSEGKALARKVRTQALTVITRTDVAQPEKLKVWYKRLILASERRVAFWDQQVQIANGIAVPRIERIRPINTAGEHRHYGKPGYPTKRRP